MIPLSCSRTVLGLTLVPKSKKDIILQDPPVNLIESLQKKTHAKSGERSVERTGHRQEKQYPISTQNVGWNGEILLMWRLNDWVFIKTCHQNIISSRRPLNTVYDSKGPRPRVMINISESRRTVMMYRDDNSKIQCRTNPCNWVWLFLKFTIKLFLKFAPTCSIESTIDDEVFTGF